MSVKTLVLLATTIAAESLPVATQVYSDGRAKLMRDPSNTHAMVQTALGGAMIALSFHFAKEGAKLEQVKHGTEFIKDTVSRMVRALDKAPPSKAAAVPHDLDPTADVWPTPPMGPVPPGNVDIRERGPGVWSPPNAPPHSGASGMFRAVPTPPPPAAPSDPATAPTPPPPATSVGSKF